MSVTESPSGAKSYFTTANTFEKKFGFHRAVRKGPFIFVAGTTALNPDTGEIDHPNDAFLQANATMAICMGAVKQLGGKLEDVVRVRMFIVVSRWFQFYQLFHWPLSRDSCPESSCTISDAMIQQQ